MEQIAEDERISSIEGKLNPIISEAWRGYKKW